MREIWLNWPRIATFFQLRRIRTPKACFELYPHSPLSETGRCRRSPERFRRSRRCRQDVRLSRVAPTGSLLARKACLAWSGSPPAIGRAALSSIHPEDQTSRQRNQALIWRTLGANEAIGSPFQFRNGTLQSGV